MAQTVAGEIIVKFGAETSTFRMELDRTNAALRQAGQSWTASIGKLPKATREASQRAAADFRKIGESAQQAAKQVEKSEGNITRLMATRALTRGLTGKPSITSAERFIGDYLNLGNYAKAIFPVTGGLAVGVLLAEFVDKIQKVKAAIDKVRNDAQSLTDGFRAMNLPLQQQNDELDASNAKLANEIAKLQGKPTNGLAEALADARVMADKLAISLDKDLSKAQDLLKENSPGFLGGLMGFAGTEDIQKEIADFRKRVKATQDAGVATLHSIGNPGGGPGHPLGIRFTTTPQAVNADTQRQTLALYDGEISNLTKQLGEAQGYRLTGGLDLTGTGAGAVLARPEARVAALKGLVQQLKEERDEIVAINRNQSLTKTRDALAARSAASGPPGFKITADMRARLKAWQDEVRLDEKMAELMRNNEAALKRINDEAKKHAQAIQKEVDMLNAKTAALRNLTNVVGTSQQAQRNAAIVNMRNEGAAAGEDPRVIEAKIQQQKAQWAYEDAQNKTVDWTKGGMKGGAYEYFQQMNDNIQTTAQNVNTVLGGAFKGLGSVMTQVIDGQRGAWSNFFFSLARQFSSIGLNKIFGLFSGFALGKLSGGLSPMTLGGGGSGLLSALSSVSMPAFASGGYSPGGPILVGENGPEIISSRPGDYITSNNKLGRGAGAMYYIDARGANAADVESRVHRALVAVHGSAVQNAVAVQKEIRARSPRSKFQP